MEVLQLLSTIECNVFDVPVLASHSITFQHTR